MKKTLVLAAAIAFSSLLVVLLGRTLAGRLWAKEEVTASAARPWPGGLGTLDSLPDHLPPLAANAASLKFMTLANALRKSEAADNFVWREIERGELTIGPPPPLADLSAIRHLLLGEPIVWERHAAFDDPETATLRATLMNVARTLIASALAKARLHDPDAWEDLHAVWNLSRALDPYPQTMLQTAAFSMSRMVNAVAWKMPLPVPPWFVELQQRDYVPRLLAAFQYQAASYWKDSARIFPTKWLASSVEHDRRIAEDLFHTSRCEVSAPMNDLGVDLSSVWHRAFRYRAEREATANALRIRQGAPVANGSQCSDGTWTYDGTTLQFSRPIPALAPDRAMPLVLRVKR